MDFGKIDKTVAVLVKDVVTGEFFPAHSLAGMSTLKNSSAALRWVRVWDHLDYSLINLQVPDSSFLGSVLTNSNDGKFRLTKLFRENGYPVSISFSKIGGVDTEFDIGVMKDVQETDAFESSGVVEYDIALQITTPLELSRVIEEWKEEYEKWQLKKSKGVA